MGFVVRLLMRILDKGVNEEVKQQEDGKVILKMNVAYGIVGIAAVIISIMVAIIAIIQGAFSSEDWMYALILIAIFALLGIILTLFVRNTRIEANNEQISYTGISGKTKKIKWKRLKQMKFNKSSKEIILNDGRKKIKIHMHFKGSGSLLKLIKENVNPLICSDTLKEFGM